MATSHARRPHTLLTRFLALTLPTLATAVSLSSFSPSIIPSSLTPTCNAVYTSTITGCTPADFAAPNTCSNACIDGLVATASDVYSSCSGATQDNQLLIGQFLAGQGISTLCPGVVVVTLSSTSSTTPTPTPNPTPTPMMYGGGTDFSGNTWLDSSLRPSSLRTSAKSSAATSTAETSTTTTSSSHASLATVKTPSAPAPQPTYSPSSISADFGPSGTLDVAAAQSSCVEFDSNPFNSCTGAGTGNVAAGMVEARRTGLWALVGAWAVVAVVRGVMQE